jgi:hypothetical protein
MTATKSTVPAGSEQLIGALVPAALSRPTPAVAPLPLLPVRRLPTAREALPLLDLARLDHSGRLSARAALKQLGWHPGHHLDIDIVDGALLVASAVDSEHVVGSRGALPLPAAARTLCGVTGLGAVVVAAYPSHDVAVIHPVATVGRLVHQLHLNMAAGNAG